MSELFKELPAKSSFTSGGSSADDIKSGTEKLEMVDVVKAGFSIGIIFEIVDFDFKMVGKIIGDVQRF